jgi:hypothetical protein
MYHKRLNWLWFFPKGKKDPVYSRQSGSKIAHLYIYRSCKKLFIQLQLDYFQYLVSYNI